MCALSKTESITRKLLAEAAFVQCSSNQIIKLETRRKRSQRLIVISRRRVGCPRNYIESPILMSEFTSPELLNRDHDVQR